MNMGPALLAALSGNGQITEHLGRFKKKPSIHTRRPAPEGAEYPMILIAEDAAIGNQDSLTGKRPIIVRDVGIYGQQDAHFREVETLGYLVRAMFHRNRFSIAPEGYRVIDIVASGPIRAPVSDDKLCGKIVTLTIRVQPV